ncbi:MAG: hypothetical protein U1C97_02775, partial [Candidatus Gracilibacteria bacterium]|nr:hypothetical protein [Candidatus Gracilibacteria bacterium]
SPIFIIILVVSSCTLLSVLFFIVRKKDKKKKLSQEIPMTTMTSEATTQTFDTVAQANTTPEFVIPDLGNLNLNLEQIDLNTNAHTSSIAHHPSNPSPVTNTGTDLIDLIDRYKFFQGKNLETFTSLLQSKDYQGIEQLITERFHAQQKTNPEQQAKDVTTKLLSTLLMPA